MAFPTRVVILLSLLLTAIALAACNIDDNAIRGSGNIETRAFQLSGFTELEIGTSFGVKVTLGPEFAVVVEADDNLIDDLVVEVQGSRLRLRTKSGLSVRNATLRAEVTAPDLVRIDVSGAARVELFRFESNVDREINLSGASRLEGAITAAELVIDLSGASRAVLSGTVDRLEVSVSGASEIAARELESRTARVEVEGASSATVTVTETIERAAASGASTLTYYGDGVIEDVSSSGASRIRKG